MSATAERPIDHGERIYILLDDFPQIVGLEDLYRAVNADAVYACPYGWTLDHDVGHPWPCGHTHSGPDFYHLAPGKTWDDYRRAVAGLDQPTLYLVYTHEGEMNSFHLTAGAASCAAREVGEGALVVGATAVYVLREGVFRTSDFTLFKEAILR